jgi:diaminopimelate epimerase
MKYHFYKYQGAGNDFVVINNRNKIFDSNNAKLIEFLCHRRFGVGADGLLILDEADGYDFKMTYFNSDGYEATMCGNGGRCIVAFAQKLGLISRKAFFLAADGGHEALISENHEVDLRLIDVEKIESLVDGFSLNTGVPHLVHFVDDLRVVDVDIEGRQLRFDARFQPEGVNVNFVEQKEDHLTVYTYERGVEGETMACGTGITASALSAAFRSGETEGAYFIKAKGGDLEVRYKRNDYQFTDVWLKGPAQLVYEGDIDTHEFKLPRM